MNTERAKDLIISAYNAVHRERKNNEDYDLYLARCRGAAQAYTELLMKEFEIEARFTQKMEEMK